MTFQSAGKIALFAGRGDLPQAIISACQEQNKPFIVIAFQGQTDPDLVKHTPHFWAHLGAVGPVIAKLKENQVTTIVMAGAISRPSWSELSLDWVGTKWLAKIGLKSLGDDGILSAVVHVLEQEGFEVISPSDILSNLRAPKGVMGKQVPSEENWSDIRYGIDILRTLGHLDVGQATVIQQGIVLGIEAIEGTAALLQRCADLKRPGEGGVLVKMAKPTQNHQVDLPTIGPETIQQVHSAGLKGIAVEATATQILNQSEVIRLANQHSLFLVGL